MMRAMVALLLALCAGTAAAQSLPEPHRVALPEEQAELRALTELMSRSDEAPQQTLASLDALLARLRQPSRLRGIVQYLRAAAMFAMDDEPAAQEPIAESIRLLPEHSAPLLLAVDIHAFSDQPAAAADYLLRAAELDPATVRVYPPYELSNLLLRLRGRSEHRRLGLVGERLLAIGWTSDLVLRSKLARGAIEMRVAAGEIEPATALVTRLLDPADAHALLIQRRYEPLWKDIETWAGARLERLWPPFLEEARARWRASSDPELAADYSAALVAAGHWDTLIREMLPLFSGPLDPARDEGLVFVPARLAEALARRGRSAEIDPMFERALAVWPMGSFANALNLSGNRAVHQLYRGELDAAIRGFDATLGDAARWRGQVSETAFAMIHFHRACALHEANRSDEAIASRAIAARGVRLREAVKLELCFGNAAAAQRLVRTALEGERASEALELLQPENEPGLPGALPRRIDAGLKALRADPGLRAAASRVGRILPFALNAAAPPEAPAR
jgi:hypothetical protein